MDDSSADRVAADLTRLLSGRVDQVAPRLLGAELWHGPVAVRITEVEAYGGTDDPGSHAARGRTARNAAMFAAPGTLYVYRIYGRHACANVTVGPPGTAAAVLIRAGEVIAGTQVARDRRAGASERDLARGPGRLCRALGIALTEDGTDLMSGPVRLVPPGENGAAPEIRNGPRVGLRQAAEREWRYWLDGEPSVSPYRPAAVRRVRP